MPKYREFRQVLRKLDFVQVRSGKHETWEKILDDGTILRTRVSHQHGKDIPKGLFRRMLRQCGITEQEFRELLRD
jgi:predicted RNA binding protein YcfA (HicA-like mRNA interferase family)